MSLPKSKLESARRRPNRCWQNLGFFRSVRRTRAQLRWRKVGLVQTPESCTSFFSLFCKGRGTLQSMKDTVIAVCSISVRKMLSQDACKRQREDRSRQTDGDRQIHRQTRRGSGFESRFVGGGCLTHHISKPIDATYSPEEYSALQLEEYWAKLHLLSCSLRSICP